MGPTLRLTAVAALAAVWGCFSAPSADVLFSCDPEAAPECPPGYSCESDGCCHRDGSDVDASRGACGAGETSGPATDGPTSSTAGSSSSGASSESSTTDTDTDTSGSSSSSSTGAAASSSSGG
jgi:hypothetical protein